MNETYVLTKHHLCNLITQDLYNNNLLAEDNCPDYNELQDSVNCIIYKHLQDYTMICGQPIKE